MRWFDGWWTGFLMGGAIVPTLMYAFWSYYGMIHDYGRLICLAW